VAKPADQQKVLSPIKEQDEAFTEERKNEVKPEEIREVSLKKHQKDNMQLP